jgi:hypothetical protein
MEIRGTIFVANFRGTISRQIGKETLPEKVLLRRKLAEPNEQIEVEWIDPFQFRAGGTADALPPTGRERHLEPLSAGSVSFLRAIRVRAG